MAAMLLIVLYLPEAMAISPAGLEPGETTNLPAVIVSAKEDSDKTKLWDVLTALGTAAAALFAAIATWQTYRAAKSTERAARAQRLADLWPEMQKLTWLDVGQRANPDASVARLVLDNVNIMERIAFCWDADLVDRKSLEEEMRGAGYVKLYDQIEKLQVIPSLNRSGARLLAQNPLSKKFRDHLSIIPLKLTQPPQPQPSNPGQP